MTTASDPQIVPRPPTAAWTTLSCVTSTTARSTTPRVVRCAIRQIVPNAEPDPQRPLF